MRPGLGPAFASDVPSRALDNSSDQSDATPPPPAPPARGPRRRGAEAHPDLGIIPGSHTRRLRQRLSRLEWICPKPPRRIQSVGNFYFWQLVGFPLNH